MYQFRSRPIASIRPELKFNILSVDLNNRTCSGHKLKVPCFDVSYCLELNGKYLVGKHSIRISLKIDTLFRTNLLMNKRAYFRVNNQTELTEFNRTILLEPRKRNCFQPIRVVFKVGIYSYFYRE